MTSLTLEFDRPPSAIAFMARALLPRRGFESAAGVAPVAARWCRASIPLGSIDDFVHLTAMRIDDALPVLFLHTWAFRLQMAVLTHPAFPLPLWGALQVRNHLLLRRSVSRGDTLDVATRVSGHRALEKGLEVDLHTIGSTQEGPAWEGLTTYYYRGPRGGTDAPSPLARSPASTAAAFERWATGAGSGLRFGRLTGDFNGVHWSDAYARRFGFARAFHHPQRVLGQALARVAQSPQPGARRLDAWLKGPVFYGSEVALHGAADGDPHTFAVQPVDAARPAIVLRWLPVAADAPLTDCTRDGDGVGREAARAG